MQLLPKMASRWGERDCADDERLAFRANLQATSVQATMAHDSYLINLASRDEVLRSRSFESYTRELRRCAALGLQFLVSHPGNYMDDRASGIARNADAISECLAAVPDAPTLCLETTAGSGTALGATFEELAEIIARVDIAFRARVGVCVDTCHVYSAGYDLVNDFDGGMARFADTLGPERLRAMHLNDSKTALGSRRHRRELIPEGSLREAPFTRVMTDQRLASVPKVIETPKLDDATATDTRMLARLRSYAT